MAILKLVGLCGMAGSGKTEAAKLLVDRFGFDHLSFSDHIKQMLRTLGVPTHNLYGTSEQKLEPLDLLCGKSARHALITLGTEWGREMIGANIWVQALESRICKMRDDQFGHHLVVDDIRFVGELEMLRKHGALILGIERERKTELAPASHISETLDFKAQNVEIINNNFSLQAFHTTLLESIFLKQN